MTPSESPSLPPPINDTEAVETVSRASQTAYCSRNLLSRRPVLVDSRNYTGISGENTQYLQLLNRVIAAASLSAFPSRGVFNMSDLVETLVEAPSGAWKGSFDGSHVESRFRSTSQLERDKKIGAAGELYVSLFIYAYGLRSRSPYKQNHLPVTGL